MLAFLTNYCSAKSEEYQKHWQNGQNCLLPTDRPGAIGEIDSYTFSTKLARNQV